MQIVNGHSPQLSPSSATTKTWLINEHINAVNGKATQHFETVLAFASTSAQIALFFIPDATASTTRARYTGK